MFSLIPQILFVDFSVGWKTISGPGLNKELGELFSWIFCLELVLFELFRECWYLMQVLQSRNMKVVSSEGSASVSVQFSAVLAAVLASVCSFMRCVVPSVQTLVVDPSTYCPTSTSTTGSCMHCSHCCECVSKRMQQVFKFKKSTDGLRGFKRFGHLKNNNLNIIIGSWRGSMRIICGMHNNMVMMRGKHEKLTKLTPNREKQAIFDRRAPDAIGI